MDLPYCPEMVKFRVYYESLESIFAFDSQNKSWLCALFWYLNFTCILLPSFSALWEFSVALLSLDFWEFLRVTNNAFLSYFYH